MKDLVKSLVMVAALAGGLLVARPAVAAVRCETQYGGDEVCVKTGELQIDKEVWDPYGEKWVDNLLLTSYKFGEGDEIVFKLRIKNVGDERFEEVVVRDSLPSHLEHVSGDLEFKFYDLDPGEVEEREIRARVKNLPDGSVFCEVNAAEVWSEDEHDKDTAQVCMEEKVAGVTTLPETGPGDIAILIFASFAALAGGAVLVRATE